MTNIQVVEKNTGFTEPEVTRRHTYTQKLFRIQPSSLCLTSPCLLSVLVGCSPEAHIQARREEGT